MLKITAIGNLTNDVELKMNEATGKPYCTKQQAENGRDRALIQYLNGQGVLMTPCRFYFGCYIDTLCGRTLRNRMSGAAARHFFFLEKVRTVSACILGWRGKWPS